MEPEDTDSSVAEYMSLFVKALETAVDVMKSLRVPAESTPTAQREKTTSCAEARARVDAAATNLKQTLLDGSLASQNPARISRTLRERLFASLKGGLDVIRELYAEIPAWTGSKSDRFMSIWSNLEIQLALEDTQEHLEYMHVERRPIRQSGFPHSPIYSPTGIRLARLLPHDDPEATIECQLLNIDHYQSRTYAVLSYASDSQHTHNIPILVDGHAFLVTPNLHAALQHFRHETRPRLLWIDALCINQSDPADKSNQGSRMRAIYQNAYTILMWAGPELQNSNTAMGVFLALEDIFAPEPDPPPADLDTDSEMDSYSDTYSHSFSYSNSYTHSNPSYTTNSTTTTHKNEVYPYLMHPLVAISLVPAVLADPNGVATRAFFNRPYWQRVWTLTETVMKKNSLLCCGRYGVTWAAVAQGARDAKGVAIAVGLEQTRNNNNINMNGNMNGISVTDTLWLARVFEPILGHAELTAKLHGPELEPEPDPDPDGGRGGEGAAPRGVSLVDALGVVVGSRNSSSRRSCIALDARDYVYGVLPIVGDGGGTVQQQQQQQQAQVDYNKPTFQVYMDLVRDEVHRSANWDILSACKPWDFGRQRERFVPLEEFVRSCLDDDDDDDNDNDGGGVPGLAAVAEALRDSNDDDYDNAEVLAESRRGKKVDDVGRVIAFSLAQGGVAPHEEHKRDGDDEDILEAGGGPGTFEDMAMAWLPSWVPRWDMQAAAGSRQTDIVALFAREGQAPFHATPGTSPRYVFKGYRGSQLQVTGAKVGVVQSVILAGDFASMWDHWVQTRESRNMSDDSPDPGRQGVGAAFRSVSFGLPLKKLVEKRSYGALRAVSTGFGNLTMGPKRQQRAAQQRAVSQPVSRGMEISPPDEMHSGARRAITTIAEATADRRKQGLDLAFFVTDQGFVGLGPMAMKNGDTLCVFFGGRAPFVLRPHRESYYLVGEACE